MRLGDLGGNGDDFGGWVDFDGSDGDLGVGALRLGGDGADLGAGDGKMILGGVCEDSEGGNGDNFGAGDFKIGGEPVKGGRGGNLGRGNGGTTFTSGADSSDSSPALGRDRASMVVTWVLPKTKPRYRPKKMQQRDAITL